MQKWTTYAAAVLLGAGATSLALQGQTVPFAVAASSSASTSSPSAQTVAIGQKVAPFSLPNAVGKPIAVGSWNKSKATVLMFVATKCPVSNRPAAQ